MDDNEIDEFIKFMEEDGIIEWVGMDTSGERTFVFNIDRLAESFPDLYEAIMEDLNEELLTLYKLGFVEVEYDENLNPGFKITQEGKQYLIDNGIPIPEEWE